MSGQNMSKPKHELTDLLEDLRSLGLIAERHKKTPLQDFVEQVAADEDDSQEKAVSTPFTDGLADEDDDTSQEKEESTQSGAEEGSDPGVN